MAACLNSYVNKFVIIFDQKYRQIGGHDAFLALGCTQRYSFLSLTGFVDSYFLLYALLSLPL